jgi:alpha-1,2-mannosyltransferase
VSLGLYAFTCAVWFWGYTRQVDMEIYRFGGSAILHGRPLYERGLTGDRGCFLFNYPPFAAALFTPLTLVPLRALRLIVQVVNIALLAATVHRCFGPFGTVIGPRRDRYALSAVGVAALLWVEPVRTTLALGQVNLALVALVVFDLVPRRDRGRWLEGVGVGVAAGIKLTPLLFIPYLLLVRRVRAAAVASAAFAATVAAGFAVAPAQARRYWFGGLFDDLARVAPLRSSGNTSVRGVFDRMGLSPQAALIVAAAVTLLGLLVAAGAARGGQDVLGLALCGMASAVASPFSWGYHWVWVVPLLVALGCKAYADQRLSLALVTVSVYVLTAAWMTERRRPATGEMPTLGLVALHPGGLLEAAARGTYLTVFALSVAAAGVLLRSRAATRGGEPVLSPASTRSSG